MNESLNMSFQERHREAYALSRYIS